MGGQKAVQDHGGSAHMLERLVFFSDAVFAIAITLLVIEIEVPHIAHHGASAEYLEALLELMPRFFGYVLSFFVIGAFWAGHHRAFGLAAHYDPRLAWPNLHMLLLVAFMPFATAFLSANLGALVPALFYNAVLLVLALLNMRVLRLATTPPVVAEDAPPLAVAQVRARSLGVLAGAALALLLTPVMPPAIAQLPLIAMLPLQRFFYWRLCRRASFAPAD